MNKNKYTVGIIGCGWIGAVAQLDVLRIKPASHAEAAIYNKKLKLLAFLDNDPLAFDFAKKHYPDVAIYRSEEEFFNHTFDIVVIATHPDTHGYFIDRIARSTVKLILCEKPISDDVAIAEIAVRKCREKGIRLLVNHMRRFDSLVRRFREYVCNEYVRDNSLGRIRGGFATYDEGLYHGGTHIIDLLRYYLGEVKAVTGVTNDIKKSRAGDLIVDAILQFDSCKISLNFISSDEYIFGEIKLIGERGILTIKDAWGLEIEITGIKSHNQFSNNYLPDYHNSRVYGERRSFMRGTYDHVVDCLENDVQLLCSGEDALQTLKVIKAIEKSAVEGGKLVSL